MSGPWLEHLALHSVGLALLGCSGWILVRCWRRDPISSYRLLIGVLLAALALPVGQWLVGGRAAPEGGLLARLFATRGGGLEEPAREAAADAVPDHEPALGLWRAARPAGSGHPAWTASWESLPPEEPQAAVPAAATGSISWGRLADALIAIWLVGLLLAGLRCLLRWSGTLRLLRSCDRIADPRVLASWDRVSRGSRLRERVRLLEADGLDSPGCWGLGRPAILLPRGAGAPRHREALECTLTHELVHLERGDSKVAALQALIRTLFWFHPAVMWVCRELDRLREISCDLLVVRRTGRPRSYALALLDVALAREGREGEGGEGRGVGRAMRAASPTLLHWTRSPSHLRRRIEMLAMNRSHPLLPARWGAGARWLAAGALLAALGAGQLAVAAAALPPPDRPDQEPAAQEEGPVPPLAILELIELEVPELAFELAELELPELAFQELEELLIPAEAFEIPEIGFTVDFDELEHIEAIEMPSSLAFRWPAPALHGLGFRTAPVSDALASHLDVEAGSCALVEDVEEEGTAHEAGLRCHDVIIAVDGREGVDRRSVISAMRDKEAGDEIRLDVLRRGQRIEVVITVEAEHLATTRLNEITLPRIELKPGQKITFDRGVPRLPARLDLAEPEPCEGPDEEEWLDRVERSLHRLEQLSRKLERLEALTGDAGGDDEDEGAERAYGYWTGGDTAWHGSNPFFRWERSSGDDDEGDGRDHRLWTYRGWKAGTEPPQGFRAYDGDSGAWIAPPVRKARGDAQQRLQRAHEALKRAQERHPDLLKAQREAREKLERAHEALQEAHERLPGLLRKSRAYRWQEQEPEEGAPEPPERLHEHVLEALQHLNRPGGPEMGTLLQLQGLHELHLPGLLRKPAHIDLGALHGNLKGLELHDGILSLLVIPGVLELEVEEDCEREGADTLSRMLEGVLLREVPRLSELLEEPECVDEPECVEDPEGLLH